jgi:hypothetical protein
MRRPGGLRLLSAGSACLLVLLALAACGRNDPALSADPDEIEFGDGQIGQRGTAERVTIENDDRDDVTIERITIEGQHPKSFVLADLGDCVVGTTLDRRGSCELGVQFAPTGAGLRAATLVVDYGGEEGPLEVALTGTGAGEPAVTLGTNRLDMGDVLVGEGPRTKETTLTNSGNAPLAISSIAIDGDPDFELARSTTCSTDDALPAGETCTLAVAFSSTELGERQATLVVEHDAAGSPSEIQLTGNGTGNPKAAVEPTSLGFGSVTVGNKASAKTVTLSSNGKASLELVELGVGGTNDDDFSIEGGSCGQGQTLDPGESCTVKVVFAPLRTGSRSATLVVLTSASSTPKEVALKGTGTAPAPEPPPPEPPSETTEH